MNIISELPQYLNNGGIIGITQLLDMGWYLTINWTLANVDGLDVHLGLKTNKRIKALRKDNGFEFCNIEFDLFCKESSILRHRTTTYTPQQNGVAERMNRTFLKKVICMLLSSGLPKVFWGEVLKIATYLINRIPSSAIDFKILEALWSGKYPDYSKLKVFGCAAYSHQNEEKLEPRSLKCIFLGYGEESKGYRLWFLTGQEEIESVERLVLERLPQLSGSKEKLLTFPIFSSLPSEKQMKVFQPAPVGFRKTSMTIPGLKYVIDPGMVKVRKYEASTGIEPVIIVNSKAQALQRSGRAGREGPGKCYRIYLEREFDRLKDSMMPEIKRCNLSNVILHLQALSIDDIIGFDLIEQPDKIAIIKSRELLFLLGALTEASKLSDLVGQKMARLPLDPFYSKALIVASEFNYWEELLIVVAMLSVESIFYAPHEKLEEVGIKWYKENFINSHSLKHARDIHRTNGLHVTSCGDGMLPFRRCLAASFFLNTALKQPDGTYRALSSGLTVHIHLSSVLFRLKPECIIFDELAELL
ncbi:pre-mRNA-splicing factor ATP-dependent RNA helicase DEAH10 [Olea europaea subsp. europaea]|uniref:RNA helicase n=1 Tax=Olea europaea subsp. europaea TaxID=158383 RepID=A0A8S0T5X1_OLEEU|nr:pre-mRNA-splicing factor ATP-dependent RNA helicase DEAH10 [Olea europaea subsp. europaea]